MSRGCFVDGSFDELIHACECTPDDEECIKMCLGGECAQDCLDCHEDCKEDEECMRECTDFICSCDAQTYEPVALPVSIPLITLPS